MQEILSPPSYFHPSRRRITFRSGVELTPPTSKALLGLVGAQIQFVSDNLILYETSFDLFGNRDGAIHFGRLWLFSRSQLRPFTKGGLGIRIVPNQQLATFTRPENLHARASLGLEQTLSEDLSVRIEAEVAVASQRKDIWLSVGTNWPW